MSKNNPSDSYEVGFGKPPRDTQFKKGVSGNPKGRPKKAPEFDDELIRESRTLVTLNENGRQRRISKHSVVVKQMINQAMKGSIPAARIYLNHHQVASEKAALLKAAQSSTPGKHDAHELSDEELLKIVAGGRKRPE